MRSDQEVAGDGCWIDAETKLRNGKDEFDIGLVRKFLEAAKPWVQETA